MALRSTMESHVKAFLSHSSKDKHFVSAVADFLGAGQVEYDEVTFELDLNVENIRRALSRSDLFVLFLSAQSIRSPFVSEESRAALEARGKGFIKKILVFAIDETSYKALPVWLQEVNITQRLSNSRACARRIQSALLALDAAEHRGEELYIGREEEEKAIRRALSVPAKHTPLFLHAVGHQGIGRRTFLRHAIGTVYPRVFDVFIEMTLSQYQGIEEFFRSLYALHIVSSMAQTISDFEEFSILDNQSKIDRIVEIIVGMIDNNELILVVDDGGVYDEQGEYQPFLQDLLRALDRMSRPVLAFAQTRMMPLSRRQGYRRSYHSYLRPLSDETVRELLSFSLKARAIEFSDKQIAAVAEHLDGHPFNVKFAIRYIGEYGLDSLINDPRDLLEWKRRRAEDFLGRLQFDAMQTELLAILAEYRYVASDMLLALIQAPPADVSKNLRALEEFCCIERRETYYHISPPIRDALRRDNRFAKADDWKRHIGSTICEVIKDYKDDDFVTVPILETATVAAARSTTAPAFLSNLILPSHLLRIARDFYDKGKRKLCMEFCDRAFAMKRRLPVDAQVEVLRLWGLSAVRLNESESYRKVVQELGAYSTSAARRVALFLEGFYWRVRGDLDRAEEKYRAAWRLAPDNQSVNRELASLYCRQRRYSDAEEHARAAYKIAPTNPFIIDILAETLLGKLHSGVRIDRGELDQVLKELQIYGDAPGSSFYLIRDAQQKARARDYSGALKSLERAIDRTPELPAPYFIRADVLISKGDVAGAERDLKEINRLLTDAGGLSEGDEAQAHELEVRILLEKRQFEAARDKIEKSAFLPRQVAQRLLGQLAKSIAFDPSGVNQRMRDWARAQNN